MTRGRSHREILLRRTQQWHQREQSHYRRVWRVTLDSLRNPDDDRLSLSVRSPGLAMSLGTGRARSLGLSEWYAAHLDRMRAGLSSLHPPRPPVDAGTYRRLADLHRADPWLLALARLELADDAAWADHSLCLEVCGYHAISTYQLSAAFQTDPRAGWSQSSVVQRRQQACSELRRRYRELEAELQSGSVSVTQGDAVPARAR